MGRYNRYEWLKQNGFQGSILNHLDKPDLKNDNRMGASDLLTMLEKKKKCWLGSPTVSSC